MKLRTPDLTTLYVDGAVLCADAPGVSVEYALRDGEMGVLVRSEKPLRYVRARWNFRADEMRDEPVKVLGDAWERGYGNLAWDTVHPERCMPWYMAVSNGSDRNPDCTGRLTECMGVKVLPNSLCFWQHDTAGVTLWLDTRCGGEGVSLGDRTLNCATVVFREYKNVSAFAALCDFCGVLSPAPLTADHVVYGSNNWYYAYGKSSHDEILADARFVKELCKDNENAPYMVIDDGWSPNPTDAPWDRGNDRFPDMKGLAEEMTKIGVRPGIWVRYLINGKDDSNRKVELPEEWYRSRTTLDPSHPEVLAYVAEITERLTAEWGYRLIKHDFSTFDMVDRWGFQIPDELFRAGWHFYDRTKTSAEIIKNFYQTIKDHANGAVIIGCNCIGHLCAGIHHLNRTGDDTSGFEWDRTRKMGVNTLAFRLPQNNHFFGADADCVGIMGKIDWSMNRRWLTALSRSGSPLFVSCHPKVPDEAALADLREAFRYGETQADTLIPLDWMETTTPTHWLLNGEEIEINWYPTAGTESYVPQV
ncbi:MAG: alpha-galactosidase [Clostridia bacterium]|nr:alpha-galactosidase [Clostridia bacterium]